MECHKTYGIEVFDIEDDNFTFDQERAKRLMRSVIETFGEGKLELSAMNGISFASLDGDLIHLMKKAGFHTLNLSYVSTAPSTKQKMKRPHPVIEFGSILKEAEKAGLNVVAYAILGIPGQTLEEMVDTLVYLMGKRVLIGPSIYYPTPGTILYERCKKDGILQSSLSQWRSSALPIETGEFNRLDMITLLRLTRIINFIKGKMDKKELDEGITWEELIQVLKERRRKEEWMDLILLFINGKDFYSIDRTQGRFSMIQLKSSGKVLDYFFKKALDNPIQGSQSN